MSDHKRGTPFRLSGGQKQRVAIAGVLAIRPRVMVLDEATAMLDPKGRDEVMRVVTALNREHKMTVVMITHFMEEAAAADRIIVMKDGGILLNGGREVFGRTAEIRAAGLELPLPSRIADKLRRDGVPLPGGILTDAALTEALCRLR